MSYHHIDHGNAGSEIEFGVRLINKRVLAPVAYHESET